MAKIAKIEKLEDSEQQCIYVSSKDHLYITDDKICTHNTIISAVISEMTMFTENGWALDLNTDILMKNGTIKKLKDIEIGDELAHPENKENKVIAIPYEKMSPQYKITLENSKTVLCHKDHIWKASFRLDEKGHPVYDLVTTQYMIDHPELKFNIPDIINNISKVVNIEAVGQAVQKCITVSADDGLFVLGNGVITHNSPEKIYTFFTKLRKRIDSRMKGNYYGRAQPLDSLVLMSDNTFKKIKDVNPGDKILTPNEGIQTVISKTEPTLQKCFELEFEDGRKVRCSPDHLWKVSFRKDNDGNKIWEVVDLQFIIDHPEINFEFYETFIKLKSIRQVDDCVQQCLNISGKEHLYYTDEKVITHNCIIDSQPNSLETPIDAWMWDSATLKNKANFIVTGSRWKYFPKDFPQAWEEPRTDWKQPLNLKKDFINAFPIFKGGDGQPPKVVETPAELSTYEPIDIEWVPTLQITSSGVVSMKEAAEESPINFLRDQAGIPSGAADRLLYNKDWIDHTFDNNLKNIYSTIVAKTEDEPEHLIWNQIKDKFFNKILGKYYFYYEPSIPRVASVDLAISGDTAGIAISHVERDGERLDTQGFPLKVYVTDLVIPVIPKGGMINLDAFKFFILDLINLGNMNIRHVSFDSFQSRAMMQSLERRGIEVEYVSVDKNNSPYLSLIDYIMHKRYYCGKSIILKNNLLSLQMVKRKTTGTTKIDHMNGETVFSDDYSIPGSTYSELSWQFSKAGINAKDISDCVAGNIHLLDTFSNIYVPIHLWEPHKELERTYENEKKKHEEIVKSLGLH